MKQKRNSRTAANSPSRLRLPVVAHGAEFLVQGYLMRRNILAYKAPPNNEGYDLICIHPDPHKSSKPIRVQVKSRYASDISYGFPVKAATFGAFDFLIAVFMNIGNFRNRGKPKAHRRQPEFFTLPRSFVKRYHNADSTWEKVRLRGMKLDKYYNEVGFELIAKALKIKRPRRPREQ